MAGKKSDLGPTGTHVSNNIERLRGDVSYAELSRRLSSLGRDIPPLGLRRIEAGERRVDADDLVALSLALGVSPATLLMPWPATKTDIVHVTGVGQGVEAAALWEWLSGANAIDNTPMIAFGAKAWPSWESENMGSLFDELRQAGARFRGDR